MAGDVYDLGPIDSFTPAESSEAIDLGPVDSYSAVETAPGVYDFGPIEALGEKQGMLSALGSGMESGVYDMAKSVGGAMKMAADVTGKNMLPFDLGGLADETVSYWDAKAKAAAPVTEDQSAAYYAGQIGRSLPLMGASMLAGPTAGAALMAGSVGANQYADVKEETGDTYEAMKSAAITALAEGIPERISLGVILEKGVNSLWKRAIKSVATEVSSEEITSAVEFLEEKARKNPDMTVGELYAQLGTDEYARVALDTAIVSGVMGAGGAAVAHPFVKPQEIRQETDRLNGKVGAGEPLTPQEQAFMDANQPSQYATPEGEVVQVEPVTPEDAALSDEEAIAEADRIVAELEAQGQQGEIQAERDQLAGIVKDAKQAERAATPPQMPQEPPASPEGGDTALSVSGPSWAAQAAESPEAAISALDADITENADQTRNALLARWYDARKNGDYHQMKNLERAMDDLEERVGGSSAELADGTALSVGGKDNPQTDTPEFKEWFGESKVVDEVGKPLVAYHGAARPDRVGSRFDPKRATSGPMAFFTENPELASSYAQGKQDTSIDPEDGDYSRWFRVQIKGRKEPVSIVDLWHRLDRPEQERIAAIAPQITFDEEAENIILDPESKRGTGGYDEYKVREARGNHLAALVDEWLQSGNLFGEERKFLQVLKLAGVEGVEYHDPNANHAGVYPVYLAIKNPLDTQNIPANVIADIEIAALSAKKPRQNGADPWDKNTRDPKEWARQLNEDWEKQQRGEKVNSHVWTSIPDWVTTVLRENGYDGIRDWSGKMGGNEHAVWIPFDPRQVKSATGNSGAFGQRKPTKEEAKARGMTVRQAEKAQEAGDITLSVKEKRNAVPVNAGRDAVPGVAQERQDAGAKEGLTRTLVANGARPARAVTRDQKLAERVAKALGLDLTWFEHDDSTLRGQADRGGKKVWINTKADKPAMWVLAHEVLHQIKGQNPKAYSEILKEARKHFTEDVGLYEEMQKAAYKEVGETLAEGQAEEELIADYLGDRILDPDFVAKLVDTNPSLARLIADTLRALITRIKKALASERPEALGQFIEVSEELDNLLAVAVGEMGAGVPSVRRDSVKIVSLADSTPWSQNAARKFIKKRFENTPAHNDELGWDIEIPVGLVGKVWGWKWKRDILPVMDQLIKEATYGYTEPFRRPERESHLPEHKKTKHVHHLFAALRVGELVKRVHIVVKQNAAEKYEYDYTLSKIEEAIAAESPGSVERSEWLKDGIASRIRLGSLTDPVKKPADAYPGEHLSKGVSKQTETALSKGQKKNTRHAVRNDKGRFEKLSEQFEEWKRKVTLKDLQQRITDREAQRARADLVKYLMENAPRMVRGHSWTLTKIKNVRNAKDLAKAIQMVDELVVKYAESVTKVEAKKILDKTKVVAKNGRKVGKFTADVQAIFDAFRKVWKMTKDERIALRDAILNRRAQTAGLGTSGVTDVAGEIQTHQEDIYLDALNALENPNWKDIRDTLKDLYTNGRDSKKAADLLRKAELDLLISDGITDIAQGDLPTARERLEGVERIRAKQEILRRIFSLDSWFLGWPQLMDKISFYTKTLPGGSMLSKVFDPMPHRKKEIRIVHALRNMREKAYKRIYGLKSDKAMAKRVIEDNTTPVTIGTFMVNGERVTISWTKAQLRKRWMELQDETLKATFDKMYTKEIKDAIDRAMTAEDKAFAEWQLKTFYGETYRRINKVYRKLNGVDLPFHQNYSPIRRMDHKGSSEESDVIQTVRERATINKGFSKMRVANDLTFVAQSDLSVMDRHTAELAHYTAWAEFVKKMNAVFSNGQIRRAIRRQFGESTLGYIDHHRDMMTSGRMYSRGLNAIDRVRVWMSQAVLGAKPVQIFKQWSAFPALAEGVPPHHYIAGLLEWANPAMWGKIIKVMNSSAYLRDRFEGGFDVNLVDLERWYQESNTRSIWGENVGKGRMIAKRKLKSTKDLLMLPITLGDRAAVLMGGWSVYRYNRQVLGKTHREAMKALEDAVDATQQSSNAFQHSAMVSLSPTTKAMTTFLTGPAQFAQREIAAIRNLVAGRGSKAMHLQTLFIHHVVLPLMWQMAATAVYIASGDDDEDKEWWKEAGIAMLMGPASGIYVIGGVIEHMLRAVVGLREFSQGFGGAITPTLSVADDIFYVVKRADKMFDGELDEAQQLAFWRHFTDGMGKMSGLPMKQTVDALVAGGKISDGKVEEGVLTLLGYSPWIAEQAAENHGLDD